MRPRFGSLAKKAVLTSGAAFHPKLILVVGPQRLIQRRGRVVLAFQHPVERRQLVLQAGDRHDPRGDQRAPGDCDAVVLERRVCRPGIDQLRAILTRSVAIVPAIAGTPVSSRLVRTMQLPVFKIWGHALGRLIQRRPPFECDIEKILDVIAESRAAIEINGDPYRLDLEPRWVREARKRKIKFVISVDAHSTGALNNVKYGVGMARRGWVRRGEVLNALGAKAFAKTVRPA